MTVYMSVGMLSYTVHCVRSCGIMQLKVLCQLYYMYGNNTVRSIYIAHWINHLKNKKEACSEHCRMTQSLKTSIFTVIGFLTLPVATNNLSGDSNSVCPLWHVERMGKCKCINSLDGLINAEETL